MDDSQRALPYLFCTFAECVKVLDKAGLEWINARELAQTVLARPKDHGRSAFHSDVVSLADVIIDLPDGETTLLATREYNTAFKHIRNNSKSDAVSLSRKSYEALLRRADKTRSGPGVYRVNSRNIDRILFGSDLRPQIKHVISTAGIWYDKKGYGDMAKTDQKAIAMPISAKYQEDGTILIGRYFRDCDGCNVRAYIFPKENTLIEAGSRQLKLF